LRLFLRRTYQFDVKEDLKEITAMFDHLAIVAVMAAVLNTDCTDSVDEPQFRIKTKRDNDKVEVKV